MILRPTLFVSYRRVHREHVQRAVNALEQAGIECFLDVNDIDPLVDFPAVIRAAIDRSHALLVWWSRDYGDSDLCLQELRRGWQHARRHSSDLARRIWIVNPESAAHHIFAGELNSENFLAPPDEDRWDEWANILLNKLRELLPEGRLADEWRAEPEPSLYNVPARSAEFTGRGRELMNIHSKLHPARIGASGIGVIVQAHGMPGVGKTALAAAYARDFAMAYPGGVYWLNLAGWNASAPADEEEARFAWLHALEQTLDPDTGLAQKLVRDAKGNPLPPARVREKLGFRLAGGPEYLWVLDNVPDLSPLDRRAHILDFIRAPSANGRTLITTRDGRVADGFAQEQIDVMREEDCLLLLARFRPEHAKAEIEAMRALTHEVGAHTHALVLLGEHSRNCPGGYPRVVERLIETGNLTRIEQIASQLRELLGERARGIVATFALSIERLDEAEKELLSLASFCARNLPIPDALLAAAFGDQTREDEFNLAMCGLLRAWLVSRRKDDTRSSFIHPLVAEVTAHFLKYGRQEKQARLANALLKRLSVADYRITTALAEEIEHARELTRTMSDQRGIQLRLCVGHFEQGRGHYAESFLLETQCLELARRVLGDEHPDTLTAMNNLSATLAAQGRPQAARSLQEQTHLLRRRALGEHHPDTLTSTNNLAATLIALGNAQAARELLEKALPVCRRALGDDHAITLVTMNSLGNALSAQGDFAGARALQEAVLLLSVRKLGEEHPRTLVTLNNLAYTLDAQGDFQSARRLHERALATGRRILGETHPDTLNSMNNLAHTLGELGELGEAKSLQEHVLSANRRLLGDDHPDTLMSMNNLAQSLGKQGDLVSSRAVYEKTWSQLSRTLGPEHWMTLTVLSNLASTLSAQGDLIGAQSLQEQVILGKSRTLGEEHPDTLSTVSNLAHTLHEQGAFARAQALLERVISIRLRTSHPEHPDTLHAQNNLARALGAQGRLEDAREMHARVLSIRLRALGKEHVDTTISAWNLFRMMHLQGDIEAARAHLRNQLLWLLDRDPVTLCAIQRAIKDSVTHASERCSV